MTKLHLRILLEYHLNAARGLVTQYKPLLEQPHRDAHNRRIISQGLPPLLACVRRLATVEYEAAFGDESVPRPHRLRPKQSKLEKAHTAIQHVQATEGKQIRELIEKKSVVDSQDFDALDALPTPGESKPKASE